MNSSLLPIRADDNFVTYDLFKKAVVFCTVFQNKQSDQELNLSQNCFPKPELVYFAFKLSEIKYYLKDLKPHSGLDPLFLIRWLCS